MPELNLVLPKVETETVTDNYGRFIISPLERGYGVTLGNTLKQILLSSLQGAAVSAVQISGVHHESSEIPKVREDMTALILNLKQLKIRIHENEPARLRVAVRGKRAVTAGDLETPPHVEIVNPDLHLLNSDSADTELDMELLVEVGQGYSPAEEREDLPNGELSIDAIFSPVRKADFRVERARVGQATDFDRLVLEITTDETISPHDALRQAAHLAVKHFALISGTSADEFEEPVSTEEPPVSMAVDIPIEELELSVRTYNSLKRAGITQVNEIIEKLKKGPNEVLAIRNFGQKSAQELIDRLTEKDFLAEVDESIVAAIRSGSRL